MHCLIVSENWDIANKIINIYQNYQHLLNHTADVIVSVDRGYHTMPHIFKEEKEKFINLCIAEETVKDKTYDMVINACPPIEGWAMAVDNTLKRLSLSHVNKKNLAIVDTFDEKSIIALLKTLN